MGPLPDDLERLRLPEPMTAPPRRSARPPRHRPKGPFLRGPIPRAWLDGAGRLPGKALAASLVLWRGAGPTGKQTARVTLASLAAPGPNEDSARRGVKAPERDGLIEVIRRPG